MKKIYFILMGVAVSVSSCQKDLGTNGPGTDPQGTIPADFNWKTTQDMTVSVGAPTVDGITPDYAVIRVYSSPVLSEENMVAKGVAKSAAPFRTAFTLPAATENIYVQTTLPDGTKSVRTAPLQDVVSLAAASLKSMDATILKIRPSVATRADANADYTEMPMRTASDFDASRTISSNPSSQSPLGNAEYYIPQGVEITSNITLDGVSNGSNPVLYVAGKLTLGRLPIGRGSLVVLPGGSVTVDVLAASAASNKNLIHPAVYVFEKGSFRCEDSSNVSGLEIVNKGEFIADDNLNLNGSTKFFNTETGSMKVDNLSLTNQVVFYQRGILTGEDLKMSDNANLYVNCCTVFEDINASNGKIYISADAALTAEDVDLGTATANLASGAMFIMDELANTGAKIVGNAQSDQKPGILVIKEKTSRGEWWGYELSGMLEVVCKSGQIHKKAFTVPAYQVSSQTVVIPESVCNGGLPPITPDPEPEPEPFENRTGRTYTYCFEDNWPYLGDYDMNDIVVVSRVDRMVSKDGSMVSALTFNWELKAAGTTYDIACGVQMDKVQTSEVASVESSHKGFGSGPFSSAGLEAGNKYAVIPLFNDSKELLNGWNTWKGHPAATTQKHTVTVTFSQAVAADAVKDSELNFFIAAKSRSNEIHMPGYAPTASGLLGKGSFRPNDPYRFYVIDGDQVKNNYMMWALMIPGEFRYPCESKDIRGVYKHFLTWAASNGTEHEEWYREDVDEDCIY